MMQDADTLLMVGSSFPYSEFLPKTARSRRSRSTARADAQHPLPMDLALEGRQQGITEGAAAAAASQGGSGLAGGDQGERRGWWRLMDDLGQPADHNGRIDPQGLFSALSRQLPDNAILSSDSGSAATGTHGRSGSAAG